MGVAAAVFEGQTQMVQLLPVGTVPAGELFESAVERP
jgi:hypothetical protein